MKFKRLVPLALALAIASTAAAEAARLPQNRFSFAVRPSYTQTVSRPSASKPLQSTAANSSYAAQVVSLVNAERARQGLPALTYVLSSGYYDAYYKKARAAQRKIREEFANAFEKCDVILTPVAPTTAYEIGSKTTNPLEMYAGDICTVSVNIAGLPGLVQPCGFDENHMPVGMQLIGPRFGEQTLLNAGLAFEQASGLKNIIAAL